MPIDLQITVNGLMAYVIEKDRIDVLILKSREHAPGSGHHLQIDQHTPALLLPLKSLTRASAPDMILDAGEAAEE